MGSGGMPGGRGGKGVGSGGGVPYDIIADDLYDCRVPLHNELAFQHGIHFESKVSPDPPSSFPK